LATGIFFSLTVCIPHNGQTAIYGKRSFTVGVQRISSGYQTKVGADDPRSLCGSDVTASTLACSLKTSEQPAPKFVVLRDSSLFAKLAPYLLATIY